MTSQMYLVIAASFLLLSCIVLVILLSRRPRKYDVTSLFESINRRLDAVENISLQVGTLSDIFLVPHSRGSFGEILLEELLKSWLPRGSFQMQYRFRGGERADAVIRLGPHLIPIDAKFPLESFKRDIEREGNPGISTETKRVFGKHIEDIARKYLKPEEGTLSFALMYVPSERIYYEVFVRHETGMMDAAVRRGVVPVSPGNLFLYLQTVSYGLKGFSFPEERKKLVLLLRQLRQDFETFHRTFDLTAGHLKNLVKAHEESASRLSRLDLLIQRMEDPGADSMEEMTSPGGKQRRTPG